jgi:dolichol-phosphate mannosyltransferase
LNILKNYSLEVIVLKALVVIPTYNERENIEELTTQILGISDQLNVLIVDDNSPDGTGRIAEMMCQKKGHVHVLHRQGKLGRGSACLAGFKYGLEHSYDIIFEMDADFSHDPKYIPIFLEKAKEYPIVIGSRYIDGGGSQSCTFMRKIISRGANLFIDAMLRLPARDCTSGFRCYQREVLESIDFANVFSEGYSLLIELLFLAVSKGFSVCEIPMVYVDRQRGKSKISKNEIFKAFRTVTRLYAQR